MKFSALAHSVLLHLLLVVSTASSSSNVNARRCKCFPGDACWPSQRAWENFNKTVGGGLVRTVPLGSPCHDPHYDEALCETLKNDWRYSEVHIKSSSSMQDPIFAGASCDPFTPRNTSCQLGNYVHYAVDATGPQDIAKTIRFATKNNIRLVIRNTGHDYMGRSTGAGGLAIWMHHLKGVDILDWADAEYTGMAAKIAAGTQGFELIEALSPHGLVAVTGQCPTVGVAGGYTQSGGHSPLSTAFGLSAHNTLEFEVITADGRLVTASPSSNADLFWALSGSGAGNYGVVVSVTLKVHPEAVTSGASFTIAQPGLNYPAIVNAWHDALPEVLDAGMMVTYYAASNAFGILSLTGYNRTQADVAAALAPFATALAGLGYSMQPAYTQFDTYHEHYVHSYGPLPVGSFGTAGEWLMGGRLLSRGALPGLGPALNETFSLGVALIGQAVSVARFDAPDVRAVAPHWRDAAVMASFVLPFDFAAPFQDMAARQDYITESVMPRIEAATPGGGAYINEADFQQPDWQQVFYGGHYPKLKAVKRRYDAKGLFYNSIAVGSERWEVLDNGRMCEA